MTLFAVVMTLIMPLLTIIWLAPQNDDNVKHVSHTSVSRAALELHETAYDNYMRYHRGAWHIHK